MGFPLARYEVAVRTKGVARRNIFENLGGSVLTIRGPKLQYAGMEKVDVGQAHKLRYLPRDGGDLKITIFIDAETFQHLRTEYERVIAAPIGGTLGESASQREIRYLVRRVCFPMDRTGGPIDKR